jgi:sec-independent protein translocase protein TatB
VLGVGFSELVLVGLVALLVVGPEQLPRLMREGGRLYGQARRAADDLRRAFLLEADRQDAQVRYEKLKERREAALAARQKASATGAVPQTAPLPGVDPALPLPTGEGAAPPEPPGAGDPLVPASRAESAG